MQLKINNLINVIKSIHWLLLINVILIFAIGLTAQYSSSGGSWRPFASHQLIIFLIFLPLPLFMASISVETLIKYSYHAYVISLFFLLYVQIFGTSAMGATRWIRIGIFNIQPSEISKISLILALARYFHEINLAKIAKFRTMVIALSITLVPAFLILKQPNLGTASVLTFIALSMLFTTVIKRSHLLICIGMGLLTLPLIWHFMHDYQKNRILSFLNPQIDPRGISYNVLQSQIAIGSGGLYGKGLLRGSQTQLSFLPEKQTDFVFTVLGEEWGFTGIILLFLLYGSMVLTAVGISIRSDNHFCKLVAIGVAALFSIHFFVNIGMVIGLLPVVGVPLPLLSYGGSITLCSLLCIGLLMTINAHTIQQSKFYKSLDDTKLLA